MITEAQADAMIALLVEIRDELQRPRLAREAEERAAAERDAAHAARLAAAHAADAAARQAQPTLWSGGLGTNAGRVTERGGGP